MNRMLSLFQPAVLTALSDVLKRAEQDLPLFKLDSQYLQLVSELTVKGKQFRGCLLTGFYDALGEKKYLSQAVRAAAAVELYGTALLIHDDIMDKAENRRGLPALHKSLGKLAEENSYKDSAHFGLSGALCLGDFLFFLADEVLATLELPQSIQQQIAKVSARELAQLGIAQIEDMRLASMNEPITKQEILAMYLGKTGRYTGRWPLELAAVLAEVSPQTVEKISSVGEKIGVLYQLVDDKLGMFGEESVTGKSVTSDITEGKKTLYYFYLQERTADLSSFGKLDATKEELEAVKKLLQKSGIANQVETDIAQLHSEVISELNSLEISQQAKAFLLDTTTLVVERKK